MSKAILQSQKYVDLHNCIDWYKQDKRWAGKCKEFQNIDGQVYDKVKSTHDSEKAALTLWEIASFTVDDGVRTNLTSKIEQEIAAWKSAGGRVAEALKGASSQPSLSHQTQVDSYEFA